MRLAVIVTSAADPLRNDGSVDAVCDAARRMLLAMVVALPLRADHPPRGTVTRPDSLTADLWPRLTTHTATPDRRACLDAAFILLADHGLAASTFAARIAASVRADPYSIALAGLGTVGGVLHGAASRTVHQLLADAAATSPERAIGRQLDAGRRIPGIGHRIYRTVDPRERPLTERIRRAWATDDRLAVVDDVRRLVTERFPQPVNVDFALGSLTWLAGMQADAGESIFVARTAGWIAHGIEEFGERPVRFRPHARYTGPVPADVPELDVGTAAPGDLDG